jgi:hypothetical protein
MSIADTHLGGTGFADLLDTLGYTDGEFVAIGHDADGAFRTAVMAPGDAPSFVAKLPDTANIFYGVNPTRGPARSNAGRQRRGRDPSGRAVG